MTLVAEPQPSARQSFPPLPEQVAVLLDEIVAGKETPAAVLAIARGSGDVYAHTAGLGRWDPSEVPAAPDTLFLLTSITN